MKHFSLSEQFKLRMGHPVQNSPGFQSVPILINTALYASHGEILITRRPCFPFIPGYGKSASGRSFSPGSPLSSIVHIPPAQFRENSRSTVPFRRERNAGRNVHLQQRRSCVRLRRLDFRCSFACSSCDFFL